MKVQQLAEATRTSPDTVRYYVRIGLLKPKKNPVNGYKEFNLDDRQRLSFISRARDLGFSLADIQQIFEKADQGDSPCPVVREIIEERLIEVKRKLDDMTALYNRMQTAVEDWRQRPDQEPCGSHLCHLIELDELEGANP